MNLFSPLKRLLPNSLFGRALLILILPVVLLQVTVAYIFYERHWDSVVRQLSASATSSLALVATEFDSKRQIAGTTEALIHARALARALGIRVQFVPNTTLATEPHLGAEGFRDFQRELAGVMEGSPVRVSLAQRGKHIRVALGREGGVLRLTMDRKRIASSTTYIFILWMVGTALILTGIAVLFLRNQIRPIVQLARVAEQSGLGHDVQGYSPRGASEVRRAGRAFLTMAERVRRTVQSRTEMLAGISHDLRTPLTRMKLEIEMAKLDPALRSALEYDIEAMRHMVDEYLDFARGDAGELMEAADLSALLGEVVEHYVRQDRPVIFAGAPPVRMPLRPQAMRRCLTNLIDNALRYGKQAEIFLEVGAAFVRIRIRDQGTGIPLAHQQDVFKPFMRLDASRNSKTGGVGLGLSIARDIAQSHGGDITLENRAQPDGRIAGLEVTIRLPREVARR